MLRAAEGLSLEKRLLCNLFIISNVIPEVNDKLHFSLLLVVGNKGKSDDS